MHMKEIKTLLIASLLTLGASLAHAQTAPPSGNGQANQVWKYKAKRLDRAEVDALLAQPDKLLVVDVRRPDELIKYGSFPVFISVQNKDMEKHLAYLPKDRKILTVSNRASRAGAAADLLASKGFDVAGATGSDDYAKQGGTAVVNIAPPAQSAAR